MESLESLPLLAGLLVHGCGVLVAMLSRLSLGLTTSFLLRLALLMLAVAISGLAIASAHHGFGSWAFSAMTLGVMVIAAVLHSRGDDADPILHRVVAARQ